MDCENVKIDFKKRYGTDCERVYFMGKPLTFFKSGAGMLGCNVSAGCYLAMEKRDDDRLMIQFSHTDRFITVNSMDLEKKDDNEIFRLLLKLKKIGVRVGGARIFIYHNSKLGFPVDALLLAAADSFCENLPQSAELFRHFPGYEENMLSCMGKTNYLSYFNCGRNIYFPFRKDCLKLVLCHIRDKKVRSYQVEGTKMYSAVEGLKNGDYYKFGRLLNEDAEKIIKQNELKATQNLYSIAVEQRESLGNGVLEDGGIFSLVENKDVDCFIRNVSMLYRRYFGSPPDFYVTDTEESGWIK